MPLKAIDLNLGKPVYAWEGYPQLWIWHVDLKDSVWDNRSGTPTFRLRRMVWQYLAHAAKQLVFLDPVRKRFGVFEIARKESATIFKFKDKIWDYMDRFTLKVNDYGFVQLVHRSLRKEREQGRGRTLRTSY